MDSQIAVGLGELKLSADPSDVLIAYGLGSCVGIAAYDPVAHLAALLHAVLPERLNGTDALSPKYVDSGVQALLHQVERAGGERRRLIVRMVGGANMLVAPGFKNGFNIGDRNVAAARTALRQAGLRLQAEDVGGHAGRTTRLFVADGRMTVRVLGMAERNL